MDKAMMDESMTVTLMGHEFSKAYLHSRKGIRDALESGEVEGVPFRLRDGDIESGDIYIAERNTGLKILTCAKNDHERGWIEPVESAYLYDVGECLRIELLV